MWEKIILGNADVTGGIVFLSGGVTFIDPRVKLISVKQLVVQLEKVKNERYHYYSSLLRKVEDIESEILASKFSNVWNVVSALKFMMMNLWNKLTT